PPPRHSVEPALGANASDDSPVEPSIAQSPHPTTARPPPQSLHGTHPTARLFPSAPPAPSAPAQTSAEFRPPARPKPAASRSRLFCSNLLPTRPHSLPPHRPGRPPARLRATR